MGKMACHIDGEVAVQALARHAEPPFDWETHYIQSHLRARQRLLQNRILQAVDSSLLGSIIRIHCEQRRAGRAAGYAVDE